MKLFDGDFIEDKPYLVIAICGVTSLIVFLCFSQLSKWYQLVFGSIGFALGFAWGGPMALYIVSSAVKWLVIIGIFPFYLLTNSKKRLNDLKEEMGDGIFRYAMYILLLGMILTACYSVSFKVVRLCATTISNPDPHYWKGAYMSENQDTYSYHHDMECVCLQQVNPPIILTTVDNAEKCGRKACMLCLQENKKYQYDKYIIWGTIPVAVFLILLTISIINIIRLRKAHITNSSTGKCIKYHKLHGKDISNKTEQENKRINTTNQDTENSYYHKDGTIHRATLKDVDCYGNNKLVFIVDGNVVMNNDGSAVDIEKSDKSIVIYDPIEKTRRIIDPNGDFGVISIGIPEFIPNMCITFFDENDSLKMALVNGRVRWENFEWIPDDKGNNIEFFADGKTEHDWIFDMNNRIVGYSANTFFNISKEEDDSEVLEAAKRLKDAVDSDDQTAIENAIARFNIIMKKKNNIIYENKTLDY